MHNSTPDKPLFSQQYPDLASARLGGETLSCSDDFFAGMENLLKPGRGVFIEDKYTDRGKWMDGWESRRSYGRNNGRDYDWCVIRLGAAGVIRGFDIDTNHFRGNAPLTASVEGCYCQAEPDGHTQWHSILPQSPLLAHSQNWFAVDGTEPYTHVRMNIFPDGGVARFRVYGEVQANWQRYVANELVDLAAAVNGGRALLASDMFFSDKNNLLMPGRGVSMADGWETKRRRDPGPDWVIIKLAAPGNLQKVLLDTHHFKGNFPDSFSLEAIYAEDDEAVQAMPNWQPVLPQTRLQAHREHWFIEQLLVSKHEYFTHVRLNIFPDGGVSRLRLFGALQAAEQDGDSA